MDSSAAATVPAVKRYAPPNQRIRSLGRRKSGGEGLERANSHGNEMEKNPIYPTKTAPTVNQWDLGRGRRTEKFPGRLIPLSGCHNSEAFQLLNDRWTAAMHAYTNLPVDSSEKPVLYSRRNASPLGHAMLPHLMMQPGINASSSSQKDFLSELRAAIGNSPGYFDAKR